ncbi:MAG: hypothetical protein K6A65_03305 [Succinivibrionaceae bacterium]|nr:hypothetical protein [Succinivibrionaceae bacterium]
MALSLNEAALGQFENLGNITNGNAIVTAGQGGRLQSTQNFHGHPFRWMRSDRTEQANNAVRTTLLKSLGEAFGIKQGMGTDNKGRATFSRAFMDKLSDLIGPELKAKDFGIDPSTGLVSSGRPLTKRRINAIMSRAALFKELSFGKFSKGAYTAKLNAVLDDLKSPATGTIFKEMGLDKTDVSNLFKSFKPVKQCIKFTSFGVENFIKDTTDYAACKDIDDFDGMDGKPRFEMYDPKAQKCLPLTDFQKMDIGVQQAAGGILLHLDNAHFSPYGTTIDSRKEEELNGLDEASVQERDANDIGKVQEYVGTMVKSFAKTMLDTYMMSKQQGKLRELFDLLLNNPGACMEGRLSILGDFIKDHLLTGEAADEAKKASKETDFAFRTGKDASLGTALSALIEQATENDPDATWDDIKDGIIKEMAGVERPIVTLDPKGGFVPVMDGKDQVVRAVTAEEVDQMGRQIMEYI